MSQPRGRPFEKGNKFGKGRPKGSPNKVTAAAQALLNEHSESLMRKCIIDALRSDRVAMRLCIERILPPRRDGFVQFSLPAINSITGVVAGYQQLLQSVAAGKLTPEAGVLASELLDKQRHILETLEYDERISQVEAECGLCDKEAA